MAVSTGLQNAVAVDVVQWMFTFLDFADMRNLSTVSSYWPEFFRNRRLYERLANARWAHQSVPSSYRFDLMRFETDWKSPCLCREKFLHRIEGYDDDQKTEALCSELTQRTSTFAEMEILRIMSELHDFGANLSNSRRTKKQLRKLVAIFVASNKTADDLTQLLSARAIGILSVHEENREVLMDSIPELMGRIRARSVGVGFLREALWSLVILCRPRGGAEGRPFNDDSFWQNRATHIVSSNGGLSSLLQLIEDQRENPAILSRIFWLLVNLCLCQRAKKTLQNRDVMRRVVNAMRRFPDHEELQHRAIFSAINLCVADQERKEQIFNTGIVQQMFCAMENFPDSEEIHRYSCCVIRALRTDNEAMRTRFARLGVVARVHAMIDHFSDSQLLLSTARQTLSLFQLSSAGATQPQLN